MAYETTAGEAVDSRIYLPVQKLSGGDRLEQLCSNHCLPELNSAIGRELALCGEYSTLDEAINTAIKISDQMSLWREESSSTHSSSCSSSTPVVLKSSARHLNPRRCRLTVSVCPPKRGQEEPRVSCVSTVVSPDISLDPVPYIHQKKVAVEPCYNLTSPDSPADRCIYRMGQTGIVTFTTH